MIEITVQVEDSWAPDWKTGTVLIGGFTAYTVLVPRDSADLEKAVIEAFAKRLQVVVDENY